jgi:multidrug efflux pump subunit AcrB
MVVLTTVLGSILLLKDPFFGAMAVCIIFGLSFAAVLSPIVMPALYMIIFRVEGTGESAWVTSCGFSNSTWL